MDEREGREKREKREKHTPINNLLTLKRNRLRRSRSFIIKEGENLKERRMRQIFPRGWFAKPPRTSCVLSCSLPLLKSRCVTRILNKVLTLEYLSLCVNVCRKERQFGVETEDTYPIWKKKIVFKKERIVHRRIEPLRRKFRHANIFRISLPHTYTTISWDLLWDEMLCAFYFKKIQFPTKRKLWFEPNKLGIWRKEKENTHTVSW